MVTLLEPGVQAGSAVARSLDTSRPEDARAPRPEEPAEPDARDTPHPTAHPGGVLRSPKNPCRRTRVSRADATSARPRGVLPGASRGVAIAVTPWMSAAPTATRRIVRAPGLRRTTFGSATTARSGASPEERPANATSAASARSIRRPIQPHTRTTTAAVRRIQWALARLPRTSRPACHTRPRPVEPTIPASTEPVADATARVIAAAAAAADRAASQPRASGDCAGGAKEAIAPPNRGRSWRYPW